jgi:hypothetical protein
MNLVVIGVSTPCHTSLRAAVLRALGQRARREAADAV